MAELIAKKFNVGINYVAWPEVALKIESGDTVFDDDKIQSAIGTIKYNRFENWVNNI